MKKLLLGLACSAVLIAQTPVFKTETRIVEIPVIAKDSRNSPVADLRVRDFVLLDNGIEQSILTLEKFGKPVRTGERTPPDDPVAGRLGPRRSIIVLDKLSTPFQDQIRGHAGISEMLRKLPETPDKIAIYTLGEDLRMLCDFTSDLDIIRKVIEKDKAEQLDIGALPLTLAASNARLQQLGTPDPFHYAERRFEITLDAFARIAHRMKGLPGEKSLLWMTAGFPPPENPHQFYEVSRRLRDARVRMYPIDDRGLIACLILPCPPSVYLPIGMMKELAAQTGGRAFYDSNALAALARAALDDSRQGYLLTYAPSNYRRDGLAHTVNLQVSQKGIELRYRSGYVADLPSGQ